MASDMKIFLPGFLVLSLFTLPAHSQIDLVTFATGLSSPVDIKNCGDSRLFVVEQVGRIKIVDSTGTVNPTNFLNISTRVASGGERGLLGLAFPPDYLFSGYFYVNYTSSP